MPPDQYVCVIDKDKPVREVACLQMKMAGMAVRGFASAQEFLTNFVDSAVSCVVTDLQMSHTKDDEIGSELLDRLQANGSQVSIVVLTAHADVRSAVRLMESGALTLLEKPYEPAELLAAVNRGIQRTAERRELHRIVQQTRLLLTELTEEERNVLDSVVSGLPNKAIALKLDISMRTVDRRRQAIFSKMQVSNVVELATKMAQLTALENL